MGVSIRGPHVCGWQKRLLREGGDRRGRGHREEGERRGGGAWEERGRVQRPLEKREGKGRGPGGRGAAGGGKKGRKKGERERERRGGETGRKRESERRLETVQPKRQQTGRGCRDEKKICP